MKIPSTLKATLKQWNTTVIPDASLHVAKTEIFTDEKAVQAWWAERLQPGVNGWAQFSSENITVRDGIAHPPKDALLLCAELCHGHAAAAISHHLRRTPTGWVATEIKQIATPGSFVELVHLAGEGEVKQMTYAVSWEGSPLRPVRFRLVGITFAENKSV